MSKFCRFLGLTLLCACAHLSAEEVIFSEVMYHPIGTKPEFIEVTNLTSNRLDIAKWTLTGGVTFTFPDFNPSATTAHFLKEYERLLLSSGTEAATRAAYPSIPASVRIYGPWVGALGNGGDTISLKDAVQAKICDLTYSDSGKWSVVPDGTGHSLVPVSEDRGIDDWRNWKASLLLGGSPGVQEFPSAEESALNPVIAVGPTTNFTDFNGTSGVGGVGANVPVAANPGDTKWRWYNKVAAPAANWNQPEPGFVYDANWGAEGYAPIGREDAGAPFPGIRTAVAQTTNLLSYYFRTTVNWSGSLAGNSFAIDGYIDDGVVLYLNGTEIGRVRVADAVPTHTSIGASATDAAFETNAMIGGNTSLNGLLLAGTNTLAAEVHQVNGTSSDHVLALRMKITQPDQPGVLINEVKPGTTGNGFVEFYNPTAAAIDLNGYYLSELATNLTKYQITTSLIVPAFGFATVGYAESSLPIGSQTTVYLTEPNGTTKHSAISKAMAVDGRSLGRKPAGSANWYLFSQPSPGSPNTSAGGNVTLHLSEARFSATHHVDTVEIANTGSTTASGAGLFISSKPDFSNKVALSASFAGGGFATLTVDFTPDSSNALVLYFTDALNNVVESAAISETIGYPSMQRFPLTGNEWYHTAAGTLGAANVPSIHAEIVINEIMAAPPSNHADGEFLELINKSGSTVSLAGWRMVDGVGFDFPPTATLGAGQYLVLAKNPTYMTANYGAIANLYGPFSGTLKDGGELLRLEDERGNLADLVDYNSGGQWPDAASGAGSSLELIHPDMDNSKPSSWRASDESNKTTMQSYSFSGIYKELRGQPNVLTATREFLLNLAGDGHVLLKNLKLTTSSAPTTNQFAGGDATSHGTGTAVSGWLCTGTHCLSDTDAAGFHLLSVGTGDTKANKAEADVIGIIPNDTLTLTFDARWLAGTPLMVAQTWDRSFGKLFRFPIPNNLGTPGAVNSKVIAAAAPTVDNMTHFPVVPLSTQPVVVTARVTSATALTSVSLIERIDNITGSGTWNTTAMNDAGTGGDAVAGDGIYSATVAARADSTITQFYIRATATNGQINECPRSGATRPGLWIVDNTPPSGTPGILTHRYVLSLQARNALTPSIGFSTTFDWDHPRMSNYGWNSTIIINEKDVLYNAELRRGGSPWTRTASNILDRARWKPPGDNVFRGRSKTGIDNDATNGNTGPSRFNNRTVRYLLYLLGYPVPDSEFVQQIVNADNPRLGDDQEQTDSGFFDRAYDNGSSEGELFEIDDAWFMYDTNNMDDRISADGLTGRFSLLDWNNSTAAFPNDESPIFFHGNFPVRFPEDRYDYGALSAFIKKAFNGNSPYTSIPANLQPVWTEQIDRMLDIKRAALYAAVRGYIGDWDNFTANRGKNGYFFRRPTDGKFEFHHWDSDLGFQTGYTSMAIPGTAGGLGWTNVTSTPIFRRYLNFYLSELIQKYTKNSVRMNAFLDANNYQNGNADPLAPFTLRTTSKYAANDAVVAAQNQEVYTYWWTAREANAIVQINATGGTNYTRTSLITTANNQTVATPTFTLTGEANSNVFSLDVLAHPEARFAWTGTITNTGLWTITNIALANGLNNLTVRLLGVDGSVINTLAFAVTLTGNGAPVIVVTLTPPSGNLSANELVTLDATGSYDPEATALSYAWTITPTVGTSIAHSVPGKTEARFQIPGIYSVSLTVTDAASNAATYARELTVTNGNDFHSFGSTVALDPAFTVTNAELRDDYSPSSWYSVADVTGRLELYVLDDVAKPLGNPTFTHPIVTRDVPDNSDFTLQTDLTLDTRQFGNFFTGLWLETTEGGVSVKYAFGIDGGNQFVVQRAVSAGVFGPVGTSPLTGSGAVLRIRRSGLSWLFQRGLSGVWTTIYTQVIPAGSIGGRGGVFVSTSSATTVRVAFDYILVADPANTNSVLASLRISEIMYNPAIGGVEYLELCNYGPQPINLLGCSFDNGKPFAAYTFGNETLQPGEVICLTENVAAFQAKYGNAIRLAGAWSSGSLSNGGETILLRDASANEIHNFAYHDNTDPTWPAAPDGTGPALEIIDAQGRYDLGNNWRASAEAAGSPGYLGLGPDTDGDGLADIIEARFGTDPNNPGSKPNATSSSGPSGLTLTWPAVNGRSYRVEKSTDLQAWTALQTVTATSSTGSYADNAILTVPHTYYRIAALP